MLPQGRAVCPHCFHEFSKPVYLIVIGWKTYFKTGTWPVAGPCLSCGELLLTELLVDGEYDAPRPAPSWENWAAGHPALTLLGGVVIVATAMGVFFWAWRG
ncbi:MAG: hypothetical protein A3G41_01865 [Elusimicrobia bacterium RIFCSPLOWO2_12_FULL_59_9]|nr:MAG: hypothetical protein A3G41_01865 [Elusimicrobia bacterium RIFCSPLOWO2_12_FULL_59_9]